MTLLVSVDPGKMTGVALIRMGEDGPELLETHEMLRDELEPWLERVLLQNDEPVEVVAERFKISDIDAQWSLLYLGVLSYLSRRGGHGEPVLQTPADAKSFVDNDKLRSLGFWHTGEGGHANDALRHAVLYLVRKKKISAASFLD